MTIYSDSIGNRFLGDCIWANHNVNYPTTKFLKAHPHSSISQALNDWITTSGNYSTFIASQSNFDNFIGTVDIIRGGFANDTNFSPFPRWKIRPHDYESSNSGGAQFHQGSHILNGTQDGSVQAHSVFWMNNIFTGASGTVSINSTNTYGLRIQENNPLTPFIDQPQWFGVMNNSSIALNVFRYDINGGRAGGGFWYIGILDDLNTNFNYYNSDPLSKYIVLSANHRVANVTVNGGHWLPSGAKLFLQTGDAQYPIVCADAQTPTSQWATDMYVFDNNATLGFPAIGRVRNLLLATGSYTIGKPVKIQGNAMPDAGFNRWLPVGSFSGKTVLMRCYSSVDI